MAAVLSFLQTTTKGFSNTPLTFSSQSFGGEASDRIIVAAYCVSDTLDTVTGCTIGGVTATLAVKVGNSGGDPSGTTDYQTYIYYAAVPTGTSGSVVFTASGYITSSCLHLYSLTGAGETPTATARAGSTNDNVSTTIDLVSEGCFVAAGTVGNTSTHSFTAGVPTTDYTAYTNWLAGHGSGMSAETGRTISASVSGSGYSTWALAVVAWGPPAGSTPTLTADVCAMTLTPVAAGLRASRVLPASPKALTLTPQAATLTKVRSMAADVRALTLTPIAATLRKSRTVAADVRAMALTPIGATLRAQRILPASVRALTLTPIAATLYRGRILTASGAVLTLTPVDASLARVRRLLADVRALTLTPQAATLTRSRVLTADAAALTLTPVAIAFRTSNTLHAGTAQLVLVPGDAILTITPPRAAPILGMIVKPASRQIVDPRTGAIRQEWELFFRAVVERLNIQ